MTSRAEILAAARRLIDEQGWEKLTIRQVAAELGIGATTLYHHVRNKEDLLLLLITEYANQIPHPELPEQPRDRIIVAMKAGHDAFAAWPWAAEVVIVDGFIGRLGDHALWLVEVVLAGAVDYGCTPAQSVYVFRSLWYYTVGEILVRARSKRDQAAIQGDFDFDARLSSFDPERLPVLAAIGAQWGPLAAEDNFLNGLTALVDGLLAQATATN
ncbi:TetR/AcrR family transcriptional regulator [Kribbella deserti]|uniref:TetR/AcrR family transcriptional regulator n=1 Tax=Kribbella deserti TaxID=1926257 RepID=A0ABV6QD51_9ACTN